MWGSELFKTKVKQLYFRNFLYSEMPKWRSSAGDFSPVASRGRGQHTCNLALSLRQKDLQFHASLDHRVRPHLKN